MVSDAVTWLNPLMALPMLGDPPGGRYGSMRDMGSQDTLNSNRCAPSSFFSPDDIHGAGSGRVVFRVFQGVFERFG